MYKKIFCGLFFVSSLLGSVSCSRHASWWNGGEYEYVPLSDAEADGTAQVPLVEDDVFTDDPKTSATVFNKRVPTLNSLTICRNKQCAPAELSNSKEYIYNSLTLLMDNNLDETALLCEANPQAHACVNPYLTVPAKIGVTPAYVFFDGVKIVDASLNKGKSALNLVLGYNLSYNGQTPTVCKPDTAMMYVKNNNDIVLNGNGFKCEMTSLGTTTIRVMFAIDYIDLDYGYIGGYYSIGLSGPANGGGSGYGMIRLPKDAYPLKPGLNKSKKSSKASNGSHSGGQSNNQNKPASTSNNLLPVVRNNEGNIGDMPAYNFNSSNVPSYGVPMQPMQPAAFVPVSGGAVPPQPGNYVPYRGPAVASEPEAEYEGSYVR